ncbi:MAG TPA: hypothetical protein VM101_16360 [Flavitalea sp.]|nr:hypothetical protein [Flavitalea sp.]
MPQTKISKHLVIYPDDDSDDISFVEESFSPDGTVQKNTNSFLITSSAEYDKLFTEKNLAGFVTKPLDNLQEKYITDCFIEHCTGEIQKTV